MAKVKEPDATYVVNSKGKKTAIILPIERYERLLEDLEDLAVMTSRDKEPDVPWEEVKKRLKKDGLLPNNF